MSLSTIIFALSITVICTVHAGDGVNSALDESNGNANDHTLRRLKDSSWAQELKEVNEVKQELAALSAANDALRDEILAEYLYDEEDSSYYDDDNADEAFMDWFESLSADEQQYYFDMMPETAPAPQPPSRPYSTKRQPSWCDRILMSPVAHANNVLGGTVKYWAIDQGGLIVKSDHDMIAGYLPNAQGMEVLIVSWNMDNAICGGILKKLTCPKPKVINAQMILPFIQSSVNAKQPDLFKSVDLYFFAFQEVGKKYAKKTADNAYWNFLDLFKSIDETKFANWKQVSMYGNDNQGTVIFIVYNSNLIDYDGKQERVVTNFGPEDKKGDKAYLLSGQFKKKGDKEHLPLSFAGAHLPFRPLGGQFKTIPCSPSKGRPSAVNNCGLKYRKQAMESIQTAFKGRNDQGSLILAGDLNFRAVIEGKGKDLKVVGEQLKEYMNSEDGQEWKEIQLEGGHPPFAHTCKRK